MMHYLHSKKVVVSLVSLMIVIPLSISIILAPQFFVTQLNYLLLLLTDSKELSHYLQDSGYWSYVFIVGIQVIQVVLFPLPGHASIILAGYFSTTWGLVIGFLLAMLGLILGSVLAFIIGRYFFRDWVEKKIAQKKGWQDFARLSSGKGLWVLGLIYAIPGFPNDFMCYILGVSRAPLLKFTLVMTVCRIPNVLIILLFGYYWGVQDWWLFGLIGAVILITIVLVYINKPRIEKWINQRFQSQVTDEVIEDEVIEDKNAKGTKRY